MSLPDSTECIEIAGHGGAGSLRLARRPLPPPGHREVLIRVHAAGVNRPDILQRQGLYPPPDGTSDIPGLEVSGTVIGTGPGVSRWRQGDEVCALVAGGGYSRHALAHEALCLPVPSPLSLTQAAALPETFFTVWYNLVERGRLRENEVVLIHGGSSGIGTTAIQVARALGARVYTTAGTDEKCRACETLGAERAFNYRSEDFLRIKQLTDRRGADVIIDMVGGDYIQKNIKCAAPDGRIVQIAFLQGSRVQVDLMPVMLKRLVFTGSTLRSQPVAEKARIAGAVERELWPLLDSGAVKPVVHEILPLAEAAEAHRIMENSEHIGKILLDCRSDRHQP
jgi:putative PIG3 family NAD(P)H quinone oxidoreductase